ncbi:hypothetical protein LZQ00_15550 [Sphingobacterium sp. SRCM116780]|uniref:hypothetical protein n=1 Tax=Sphingobacterium sp. SRCM116780 TaxID=2907623 RepID=UPI001F25870F|nr:hypothetical protein [Sphingobacterium sp. SRCM116780]UIR55672.1 hypothetical protein LZQ00_15550 [Sphingobacterium sp. SRCM116780]
MQSITKKILYAVVLESFGTLLTFFVLYSLFFNVQEIIMFLGILWFPGIIAVIAMLATGYTLGEFLSTSLKPRYTLTSGIIILFVLLLIGIVVGVLAFNLSNEGDKITRMESWMAVILVFLLFGGIPTLIVGIVLGKKLKPLHTDNLK